MESTNQNKQTENEIGKHLQTLEIYIKEGGKEKGTVSGDMAITSLSLIRDYLKTQFFCEDFGIEPILNTGKNIIWGKKPSKEENEKYELVSESDGLGGTKQRIYKVYKKAVIYPESPNNLVNHPSHYISGGLEVIDIIEAFNLGFHLGNAIKYILRAGRKFTNTDEDIKKSIWYLNRFLGENK